MDRFVNEDPNGNGEKDEIGFTLEPVAPYHVWNGDANFTGMWGISTDYDPLMVKDGEIVCSVIQPEYKDYIIWFRDMYTGGLIDKECFTHDHNQYMAKIDSGNVGAYLTNGLSLPHRLTLSPLLRWKAMPAHTGAPGLLHRQRPWLDHHDQPVPRSNHALYRLVL